MYNETFYENWSIWLIFFNLINFIQQNNVIRL